MGIGRKLFLVGLLSCLVFAALVGYGDFQEVGSLLVQFPVTYLLAALALALVNYSLRFLRWVYYLKTLGIDVPFAVSLLVFLSGLAMTITPGKVGELVKCYLLRGRSGVPVTLTVPVVLMERLTDLLSVVLMGLIGFALLPPLVSIASAVALAVLGGALYFLTTRHTDRLIRLPVIRKWADQALEAKDGMKVLSRPLPLLVAVTLGLVSWISEGVALWIVLKGLDADISIVLSMPIYAGSVLAGAATTLPGGLLGTEGAMVVFLQQSGSARDVAATGTLLVRVATLWFAVAVGLSALAWFHWLLPGDNAAEPASDRVDPPASGSLEKGPADG
ncbi:MAG: lysylphosphatidylglycerol synthase transmembrane domain-containing protein [Chloroflexota bacterium]|nr:lysylphosphatidylglycerol synthase transmembrane domain-containing protein [Chloroflexota bacterium]